MLLKKININDLIFGIYIIILVVIITGKNYLQNLLPLILISEKNVN